MKQEETKVDVNKNRSGSKKSEEVKKSDKLTTSGLNKSQQQAAVKQEPMKVEKQPESPKKSKEPIKKESVPPSKANTSDRKHEN